MSRPHRNFAATYAFDAAITVPVPPPMSRPSTSAASQQPQPPEILLPRRPGTSQSARQRPMSRQRSHERMMSASSQASHLLSRPGTSQMLSRPGTAQSPSRSPPQQRRTPAASQAGASATARTLAQQPNTQPSVADEDLGIESDPLDNLMASRPASPPPETGELPARVDRWELCPPAHGSTKARVIGAELMGWGKSRTVVILLAEAGKNEVSLRTYNILDGRWSAQPDVLGEPAPRPRFGAATCAWKPLDDLTATAHYRRTARLLLFGGEEKPLAVEVGERRRKHSLTSASSVQTRRLTNDVNCLTLTESIPEHELQWQWTRVRLDALSEEPSPRAYHAMCAYGGEAYMHGGRLENGQMCGRLYKLQCKGDANEVSILWTQPIISLRSGVGVGNPSEVPRPRCMHSMSCVAGKLMLFGGEGGTLRDSLDLGKEFFAYYPETCEWEELSSSRLGTKRQGSLRIYHSDCVCGPMLVLAGGKGSGYSEEARKGKDGGLRLYDCRDQLPAYADSSAPRDQCELGHDTSLSS